MMLFGQFEALDSTDIGIVYGNSPFIIFKNDDIANFIDVIENPLYKGLGVNVFSPAESYFIFKFNRLDTTTFSIKFIDNDPTIKDTPIYVPKFVPLEKDMMELKDSLQNYLKTGELLERDFRLGLGKAEREKRGFNIPALITVSFSVADDITDIEELLRYRFDN